jgi:two-component system OmpR family response regulator
VTREGTSISLSRREFSLLEYFMRRAGEVLSRTQLIEHVWDFAYDGESNVVDVYVRYLREKIDRPFGTNSLVTVRGAGYLLRSE